MKLSNFFLLITTLPLLVFGNEINQEKSKKKTKKIGFFVRHFNVRGTEIAIYDYADYNETILGNQSYILYLDTDKTNEERVDSPESVKNKFLTRFQDKFYECSNFYEVEEIISLEHIDAVYNLKYGVRDQFQSSKCLNLVHAVFYLEPHGDRYAAISDWLKSTNPSLNVPVVPHMIRLDETTETLHDELNIPKGAVIFGRHGGYYTFNVDFAPSAVVEIAESHPNWYFLFLNTHRFCNLPNVIFLPATADICYKTKFINTCDAMIHARVDGETFGLACGEFSIKNKPIFTWLGGARAHIDILGEKGFYYHDKEDLVNLLTSFGNLKDQMLKFDWDAYSEKYSPEQVMLKFEEVFLNF